jgi:KEOPS complex subunit Cgi121
MRTVEGIADVEDVDAFVGRLAAVGEEYGVAVQAFDARYVVDREHLERAVALANRAVERDDAIARDRAVEILLYAAGRRQIDRALEMGVSAGGCPAVVVVDGDDEAGGADTVRAMLDPAETLGAYDRDRVLAFFGIGEAELAAISAGLADLVRERVALLTVEK